MSWFCKFGGPATTGSAKTPNHRSRFAGHALSDQSAQPNGPLFSRSCLNTIRPPQTQEFLGLLEQAWRTKMTRVSHPSYNTQRTSLSLQKPCKQRWWISRAHLTTRTNRGSRRSTTSAVDRWRLSNPNRRCLNLWKQPCWSLRGKVLVDNQGKEVIFKFFLSSENSVDLCWISGQCQSRLNTFSPSYNFGDNHTKVFVSWSNFDWFQQATGYPSIESCWLQFFLQQNKKCRGATATDFLLSWGRTLEARLIIFGGRSLIFFCLKDLGKRWKMTPLLGACRVVITFKMQKCRKKYLARSNLTF